jgi:hypothetical protein
MSEKIYACLLRLYPARFRQRFEDESLQLFRDRLRDEQGFVRKLRLWADLLADFVLGLSQAYRNTYPTAATVAGWPHGSGLPAFRTLEQEPLRPGSIVMGGICAIAALALFIFVMNHAAAYHPSFGFNGRLRAAPAGTQSNPDVQAVAEKLDQQFQSASRQQTCSFEKLELHPGNIGYVKLSWFPDPSTCGDIAAAVMSRLNETDAIIFDLRDTRGGDPEMVRLMAGWLFDRPVPWYNPRATSPAQLLTNSPVPGSRLARKPVFVLTSSHTFSGAEHFTYNLKTLKRATIVDETTSGASHAGAATASATPPGKIGPSEPKPVWEGVGVQPDVRVDAADALRTAENLATSAVHKN